MAGDVTKRSVEHSLSNKEDEASMLSKAKRYCADYDAETRIGIIRMWHVEDRCARLSELPRHLRLGIAGRVRKKGPRIMQMQSVQQQFYRPFAWNLPTRIIFQPRSIPNCNTSLEGKAAEAVGDSIQLTSSGLLPGPLYP
jgi:hypothetical protein